MKLRLLAMLIAGIAAGGLAFAPQAQEAKKGMKKSEAKSVSVRLGQQNKSGESGSARLTPQGDKTKVEITLKGAPKGVPQPAHIHEGSCAKLDPKPKYPLQNVVDGKSTSEVPVSLDALLSGSNAINVHKSADEAKVYVACGDIKRPAAKKAGAKKSSDKKS
jgi:hypothetical protein